MSEEEMDLSPREDALKHIAARRDKLFLAERFIDASKRRGLFTNETIEPSTFVVEYRGNISSRGPRSTKRGAILKGFIYKFSWKGERWCVDASNEDNSLGRLVNDDHVRPNCEMRKVVYEGEPHLCLFASKKISPGEEITFNYGDSSYPWRSDQSQELHSGSTSSKADSKPLTSTPRKRKKMKTAADSYCDQSCSDGEEQSLGRFRNRSQITEPGSSREKTKMFVRPSEDVFPDKRDSNKTGRLKRKRASSDETSSFTKLNYCYVCGKGMTKLARHLKKHADEEPVIAEALSFPEQSAERKRLFGILRNKGNYQHNKQVLKTNVGALKVNRRTVTNVDSSRYKSCPYCQGFYKCLDLWRHIRTCTKKQSETSTSGNGVEGVDHEVPPDVKKILSSMSQDGIPLVIQNDYILVQMAKHLIQKYENNPNKQESIQQKLREMGKFLLQLHKKMVFSFEDAIKPNNFQMVVSCVKRIAGFNTLHQMYLHQGLKLRLGSLLKRIGNIVLIDSGSSETMKSHARTFIENCHKEWSGHVSVTADVPLGGQNVSSPSTIPFTQDAQTFYKYLEALSASATESLKTSENSQVYTALSRVTITQTSVLSKCTADVSNMTLKAFQERDSSTQILSKHFIKINILSKSGQNVSVLLTSQLVSALTLLISKRLACGVHKDNTFLFAKPNSSPTSHFHGGHCIKSFSGLCNAKNPEHLRLEHLKHIARIFQILNLENDELEHLAKLLGHNIRADREYYRSPQAVVELAKIAKLLVAMEKGSLERSEGNSLEEVEIEDELEPDVELSGKEAAEVNKSNLLQQSEDTLEHIKTRKDKPFLQEKFDSIKGRGVFTKEPIESSTFVLEFRGDLCRHDDTPKEECGDTLNNLVFDFSWNGTNWRLDASAEEEGLGRLVNEDHRNPNCEVMKINYMGKPHLCLFALKKISPGEEITFSYGSSSRRSEEPSEDVIMSEATASSSVDHRVEDSEESSSYDESSGEEYVCNEKPDSDDSFSDPESSQESSKLQNNQTDASDSDMSSGPSRTNKNFCYVCGEARRKMSRHLFTHRKTEPEIAEAFALPKLSKARKELLMKLLHRGNHKHNQEVLKTQKGCLKARMTSDEFSLKKSAACIYCKVLYSRGVFWSHLQKCPSKISTPPVGSRSQILALVSTGLTNPQHMPSGLRKILKKLKEEETDHSVFKDTFALQLAQCLYFFSEGKSKDSEIKMKLKLIGNLLSALKEKSIFSFGDALKPENFNSVVEAVRNLVGPNKDTVAYKRRLSKLVSSLRKMADIKYATSLNEGTNMEMMQETEEFIKLFVKEWHSNIPVQLRVPCPSTLPFIHDVQILFRHIEDILTSAIESLTMYASPPVYTALLKVTIAYVAILNRTVQEVSDVTLESFQKRNETEPQENNEASRNRTVQDVLDVTLESSQKRNEMEPQENDEASRNRTVQDVSDVTLESSQKRNETEPQENNEASRNRTVQDVLDVTLESSQKRNETEPQENDEASRNQTIQDVSDVTLESFQKRTETEPQENDEASRNRTVQDVSDVTLESSQKRNETEPQENNETSRNRTVQDILDVTLESFQNRNETEPQENDEASRNRTVQDVSDVTLESSQNRNETEPQENDEASRNRTVQDVSDVTLESSQNRNETEPQENDEASRNRTVQDVLDVTLESFQKRNETEPQENKASWSLFGEILSKCTVKVTVANKMGKKIVLVLTRDLLTAITLLVEKRKTCNVPESHPLLFAKPGASSSAMFKGFAMVAFYLKNSNVKDRAGLKSSYFRKHTATIFHILNFSNEDLGQVAKLLGRDIRTDCEFYQKPEAAADIAKLLVLLSALETECLEVFEGQSLEEIEIPVELQPVVEQISKDVESETSLQEDDASKSSSATKKKRRSSSARNRRMSREEENEAERPEPNEDNEMEKAPEATPVPNKETEPPIYFSDDDDDGMNVEFNMDIDTDGDDDDDDDGFNRFGANFKDKAKKSNETNHEESAEEMMDADEEDPAEEDEPRREAEEDESDGDAWMDVDSDGSAPPRAEINNMAEMLKKMKNIKILIPRLKLEHVKFPVLVSKFNLGNKQEVPDDQKKPASSSGVETNEKKAVQMSCSCCRKSMMKGQTAYQKKGFTDIFCSKTCLFEMFPLIKAAIRTCFLCLREISRPLDLIMAAVDLKGTMKDFCSVTCLCSFKSKPTTAQPDQNHQPDQNRQPPSGSSTAASSSLCSSCSNSCSTPLELKLGQTVHGFCRDVCLETFCRDAVGVCDFCDSACRQTPLALKLENGTKTFCGPECLEEFKEDNTSSHACAVCRFSLPVSDTFAYKDGQNSVELFCSSFCRTSFKVQVQVLSESQSSGRGQTNSRWQAEQNSAAEDGKTDLNAAVKDHDYSSACETDDIASLTVQLKNISCFSCYKKVQEGQMVYQLKRDKKIFCSDTCVTENYPHVKFDTRKCYNCCQLITQPHKMILAPADDSGSLKELCSESCLTSVTSKRSYSECRLCAKICPCSFSVTVDGEAHRFCSHSCLSKFSEENKSSWVACEICSALCSEKRLVLKTGDGAKTVCGHECLLEVKEAAQSRQLCPTCHTPHQLSDMLEHPDDEGALDFFCSHRCMKVHKAQTLPVPVKTSPSVDEDDVKDVKEVKPLLLSLPHIKEEPIDEFTQDRSESVSSWDIKQEPDELKDLRIGSVFSLTEDSKLAPVDPPGSCSTCQRILEDGATVYQRKAHTDLFCSTSCLLKFYQKKPVKTACHFCLRVITNPQDVLRAAAGTAGTKDFCSRTCLSCFNYQRIVSTKLPLVPVASHSHCSACSRHCISKHEVILQGVVHKLCSDPCFYRFCTINKLSVCESCGSACNKPLCLKAEGGDKPLCGADCLARFKKTNRAEQPCAMCRSPQLMSDMVENRNSDDIVELFCSKSCVMASKIQTICASGASLDCDNCRKTTVPVCHLAMSDASIRNFCSLTCAMEFKETQAEPTTQTSTQNGSDKPPELLCAQCLQAITCTPEVIQNEKRLTYVCSSACSQDFKRINNIVASCEHCGSYRLINEVKRIGTKNCCFCSTGCSALFLLDQRTTFSSCSFCRSVWRSAAQDGGAKEEFCSESCRSKHDLLLSDLLKCDSCGRRGRLMESLPLSGDVKHFCHLKCLLHFCSRTDELLDAGSSPPEVAGAVHTSPVLTNVVSLSSTLRNHLNSLRSSSQLGLGLFSDIQTKVVGHASVQTEPKQLKNKSMLCVPLVHNKGVSCSVQTSEAAAQTVGLKRKVREKLIPVPVPVPVYVPLPLSMYSQYTPAPVALSVPLPVPVFLSEKSSGAEEEKEKEEEEEKTLKSPEEEAEEDDGGEGNISEEDGGETKEEETQRSLALIDNISSYRDEFETDLKNQKDFVSDSILELFFDSQPRKVPPKGSDPNVPEECLPDLPPPPAPPAQVVQNHRTSPNPPPSQQTVQGDQYKAELTHREKLQHSTEAAKEEASAEGSPQTVPRRRKELSSERGVAAWRSWIKWRGSQSHLGHISSLAVTLKADLLECSSADLDVGLCLFIREVVQQRGRPVSPDHIFYLCLCIQQCLFENGRLENVFSDPSYQKFSSEMTKILRPFRPSLSAAGSVRSCVKEEFLWGCKQLGAYSPIVLLNTLLFFFCKHFGFTTVKQHRQLSFTSVVRRSKTNRDGTKTNTLRFYPPTLSDHKQPDSDGVPAKKRKLNTLKLKENKKNPLRCPVRFYEFYLSKCSESARRRSDLFYLQPGHRCLPSSPLWFSMTPLDDATLEAMIVRTLAIRYQQQK